MSDSTQSKESILDKAVKEWEKSQVLFMSPPWNGQPAASHMVEVLINHAEMEKSVVSLLSHKNQLVVAYSLLTLTRMDSAILGSLPADLLDRKEKITQMMGSFADKMELGAFARHVQKEWLKQRKDVGLPKSTSEDYKK